MAPQNDEPVTPSSQPNNQTPVDPPQDPMPVSSPPQSQPMPFGLAADTQTTSPFIATPEPGAFTPIKPKANRKKLIAIIVAAVVVVLGSSAYAAYAFWYSKPQNAVADALGKLTTAKTASSEGYMEVTSTSGPKLRVDFTQAQASQRELSFNGEIKLTNEGQTYTLKAAMVSDKDNNMYFKVENIKKMVDSLLSSLGMPAESTAMFDGLIAKIDNKWVILTPKDLAGDDEKATKEVECTTKALEKYNDDKKQQDELFSAYRKNMFLIAKTVGAESVKGTQSTRYELTFDKQKTQNFATAVKQTTFFKALDQCTDEDLTKSYDEAAINEFLSQMAKVKLELWVAQWGHNPTKVKVSANNDSTKFVTEATIDLTAKPTVTIPKADTTMDDITAEIQKIQQQLIGDLSAGVESEETTEQPVLGVQTFLPSYMTRLLQ